MENKVVTTSIKATSRCAISIKDNWYTIEATEERSILDPNDVDIDKEWDKLFDSVNDVVDRQLDDIVASLKK